ncbi:cadherin-like domain-containing protein, partial [Synechococcus sp. UW140]|uniref:tandem-95 repeat protein n=1 Tax=Synechococcus sp. UW140 TaxID=368503 RepID=UPI0025EE7FA5
TAVANATGSAQFSFSVTDIDGASIIEKLSIDIVSVNDLPILTGTAKLLADGTEDTEYTFSVVDLLAGYSDVDGDSLSIGFISAQNGNVVDNKNGTYSYTPFLDFNGKSIISFTVYDTNKGSIQATQNVLLVSVNDNPVLIDGSPQAISVLKDSAPANIGIKGLVYSPGGGSDESSQILLYSINELPDPLIGFLVLRDNTLPAGQGVEINSTNIPFNLTIEQLNDIEFVPLKGASGFTSLKFTISDDKGGKVDEVLSIRVLSPGTDDTLNLVKELAPELATLPDIEKKIESFVDSGLSKEEVAEILLAKEKYSGLLNAGGVFLDEIADLSRMGIPLEALRSMAAANIDFKSIQDTPNLRNLAAQLGDGSWTNEEITMIMSKAQATIANSMADGTRIENIDLSKFSLLDDDSSKYIATPTGLSANSGAAFNYLPTEDPYLFEFKISDAEDVDLSSLYIQAERQILFAESKDILTAPDKYLKFVSKFDLRSYGASEIGETGKFQWTNTNFRTANSLPLADLEGNIIIAEGWYDFTRRGPIASSLNLIQLLDKDGKELGFVSVDSPGNGAQLIFSDNSMKYVNGWHITFTDNLFGDKDPIAGLIRDPGSSVRTLPELGAQTLISTSTTITTINTETNPLISLKVNTGSRLLGFKPEGRDQGSGVDFSGTGAGEGVYAMSLGEGAGVGRGVDIGPGTSSSSGSGEAQMNLLQAVSSFAQGNEQGEGSAQGLTQLEAAKGKGAGIGGETSLGEDQTPKTLRKRGLLLQQVTDQLASAANETKSSSSLLKNLSEGSILGNNLLDALALGAGVLYALYAPKAVETGKKGFLGLVNRLRNRDSESEVITEKNVLSIFIMKQPNGTERLLAMRVGMGGMEVLAQHDLPFDVRADIQGNQTQLDFAVKKLITKLGTIDADILLLGPKLKGQASLLHPYAKHTQMLNTQELSANLSNCNPSELGALQNWLNKPSSTPPESSPIYNQMLQHNAGYARSLPVDQANMAGLIELSVALGWSTTG